MVLEKIKPENISLSSVTIMELYFGALSKKEVSKIKRVLLNFDILHLNESISQKAVELIEGYSKSHGLKIPDALIGATALYSGIKLFTYNDKDFRFIKDLRLY
ncbi:MAG TPA: type II toxin-antitoxin system VapC family toxin [Candidatus Wunengus sp. YC60]|uniref:type II toxin-antitoxin system VapC family toxin n=1 Tax=Candidatus Wunengus sp. YC60 TaxID=3367697 RepID=UPI004028B98D